MMRNKTLLTRLVTCQFSFPTPESIQVSYSAAKHSLHGILTVSPEQYA